MTLSQLKILLVLIVHVHQITSHFEEPYRFMPVPEKKEVLKNLRSVKTVKPASKIYQVYISDGGIYLNCTGALIHKNWIITSASCATIASKDDLKYIEGLSNLDKIEEDLFKSVEKIFVHPEFDRSTLRNDIALIKIQEEVPPWMTRTIKIIAKPQNYNGAYALVSGWRNLPVKGSSILTARLVQIVNNNECENKFHYTNKKICTRGEYVCLASHGSPLVIQSGLTESLIGVATDIPDSDKCQKETVAEFTNVGYYKDWINFIVNQHTGIFLNM